MKDNTFIWSDNWWVEDGKAWFVSGIRNILFCLNLNTYMCESAVRIPDNSSKKFRVTPLCIKCGKDIFCMPGFSDNIWIYNLNCEQFTQIKLNNPDKIQLWFDFWVQGDKIFAISKWTNKLLEINTRSKRIENYQIICKEDVVIASILVDNDIYCLSSQLGGIYQYNLLSHTVKTHVINNIEKKLAGICYDGNKFWLSGYCKEIYVWNKEDNTLVTINDFPQDFGVYNFGKETDSILDCVTEEYRCPTFAYSISIGEFIWFIPYETNKIIYVDRRTYKLKVFEIDEEIETKESFYAWYCVVTGSRYLLEYVKDERYLVLFSTKNRRILEIDTKELKYRWCDYSFSDKCLKQCNDSEYNMYQEGMIIERRIYDMLIRTASSCNTYYLNRNNVGKKIYREILEWDNEDSDFKNICG